MPSIPQSLLWISLVVLWLFVLVPMLISKRDAVRRTSDVALSTRVLNSGAGARLRRRGGPAAGHRSDPDWRPADESADLEDAAPTTTMVRVAAEVEDAAEPDYLDVDVVEDSGALPAAEAAPVTAEADVEEVTADYDDPGTDQAAGEDPVPPSAEDEEHDPEDTGVYSVAEYEYEYDEDQAEPEAATEDDQRMAESISAARRRRRESTTAAAVSARKYRFRARTIAVMAVLLLTSAVAAYTWSPSMWWACGAVGTVTALYLAYLRRQTRIEEQLRRRRAQRMARSRLGVENTSDPEFDLTPSRLRRPGAAVLEIDDEDPEFEHLEYVPFSRHYDLPRAAGQ
ncbi:hypothetical protein C6A87_022365 [Mycobacterium sp. ITM-2016-00317]|uniref:divisome protein SepX/GlpR n=1 Tax=Mycobacterium sp. ITM-2016-00317 TaxID=2099694 RepID=UPI00287F9D8A|nr:gephyrin-like molybdotransferase receptor GlpR [Mycobacterium sp. ITM-2016-00317]WNG86551.1 hypothetical protein C6A87_022365 [Mycobacterium sp. ITM-2016-00317]